MALSEGSIPYRCWAASGGVVFVFPLPLREVRRGYHEFPVDIHAAERVQMIFLHPGRNWDEGRNNFVGPPSAA